MTTFITFRGECVCGHNIMDATTDVPVETRRNLSNFVLRTAANRLIDWLLTRRSATATMECNKCRQEFEMILSGTKVR